MHTLPLETTEEVKKNMWRLNRMWRAAARTSTQNLKNPVEWQKLARETACPSTSGHRVCPLSSQTSLIFLSLFLSPSLVVPLSHSLHNQPHFHTHTHTLPHMPGSEKHSRADVWTDGYMDACNQTEDNKESLGEHRPAHHSIKFFLWYTDSTNRNDELEHRSNMVWSWQNCH